MLADWSLSGLATRSDEEATSVSLCVVEREKEPSRREVRVRSRTSDEEFPFEFRSSKSPPPSSYLLSLSLRLISMHASPARQKPFGVWGEISNRSFEHHTRMRTYLPFVLFSGRLVAKPTEFGFHFQFNSR